MKSKQFLLWASLIGALLLALVWCFAQAGQIQAAGPLPVATLPGRAAETAVYPTSTTTHKLG